MTKIQQHLYETCDWLNKQFKENPDVVTMLSRYGYSAPCYPAAEALYHTYKDYIHIKPMYMKVDGISHWFLKGVNDGNIYDPTSYQFVIKPNYSEAKGKGFLTKRPSKRAVLIMGYMK